MGSHADIETARIADIRDFHQRFYTPNNASIAMAGDFDPKALRTLLETYFGPIPRGPQAPAVEVQTPPITTQRSATVTAAWMDVFAGLEQLTGEIAAEGREVVARSKSIALQSKTHSDRLLESEQATEHLCDLAGETRTLCGQSEAALVEARAHVEAMCRLAAQRTARMEELVQQMERCSDRLVEVRAVVEQVERFLRVIGEIGNQTSLLALNAAIEAARSGPQGAGFHVVAREMKLLANRTRGATEQIHAITESMLAASQDTEQAMRATLASTAETQEHGRSVKETLAECIAALDRSQERSRQGAASAAVLLQELDALSGSATPARESARHCTFEADASAERTMCSVGLTANLYRGLERLATMLERLPDQAAGDSPRSREQWAPRLASVRQAGAACAEFSGTLRLQSMTPQLGSAMQLLRERCGLLGAPSRGEGKSAEDVPELRFGGTVMNLRHAEVDEVHRTTGLATTLFVLADQPDRGKVFLRVATNVKRANGKRATGTPLNPRGRAASRLLEGQGSAGFVYILGVPHLASYEPVFDAGGTILGAMFVGNPLVSAALSA